MRKNELKMLLMAIAVVGVSACKEKKPSEDIIIEKPVAEVKKATQKVGDYDMTTPAEWVGATYQVFVQRLADPSLPLADDGQGNKYYDNKITVKVTRKDGSVFFTRTFTKADFDSYVDPLYKKNSALLGIVFDKAEGDNLVFAASVGSPDKMSDEYVPLVLKISRFGDVRISKDTQLDTGSVEEGGGNDKAAANTEENEEEDGV